MLMIFEIHGSNNYLNTYYVDINIKRRNYRPSGQTYSLIKNKLSYKNIRKLFGSEIKVFLYFFQCNILETFLQGRPSMDQEENIRIIHDHIRYLLKSKNGDLLWKFLLPHAKNVIL